MDSKKDAKKDMRNRSWRIQLITYAILFLLTVLLYLVMRSDFSHFEGIKALSMLLGYFAFVFIGITLIMGPLKLFMPVSIGSYILQARRYVGIWSGALAILHVVTVLIIFTKQSMPFILLDQSFHPTDSWIGLFFQQSPEGTLHFHRGLIGMANYIGLIAFIFLLGLLFTSSDNAVHSLGGGTWKRIHMTNLMIFMLVIIHGSIYVSHIKGSPHYYSDLWWFAGIVLFVRFIAFLMNVLKGSKTRER